MTHSLEHFVLSETVREDFPFLRAAEPLVYLDNAATTQKPQAVLDALIDYYTRSNSNVGRGYYRLSMESTERYEHARAVVQRAIGARHPEEVIFTRSTTDATNLVVDTLGRQLVRAGDEVVVTGMEHNSNLLPWRRLCEETGARLVVVPISPQGRVDTAAFAAVLGPRTRLAAVAHVSNVLGTVNPVQELIAEAHRHGVIVMVDGAQAVPHRPVNVAELEADFYCFSGHKVYGPMGIGVLYGRRDLLSELPPYQVGGGTVKGVTFTEPVEYVPLPNRLEAGTPHVAGAVALAAAFEYLEGLGWEAVRQHDDTLVRTTLDAVADLEGVHVVGDPGSDPCGIVSLSFEGLHPYDVGGHLDRHGIAVRCGVHCASTFLDDLGLVGTVRISFGVYNTPAEIERLREVLSTVEPGFWSLEQPTTRFL
ncbi:aminotransferase class V-fold PLP-dependent enzyme [Nonomuraea africana]|uniref:cysteine desulfurase n=1 Tax=Nonomuraea africana TaxID=46171 RepID=A0ABR9KG22_9ACTN|nr:cysteine desulfurase [Nonomuraea africana]MBE1560487.1 cysteine desulfurase/selenocysteine lyase [Nonomuraea africana]